MIPTTASLKARIGERIGTVIDDQGVCYGCGCLVPLSLMDYHASKCEHRT